MNKPQPSMAATGPEWLAVVKQKVEGLSYGVVQIVVHNRRVTQIECTEKTRLDGAVLDPSRQPDGRDR